MIVVTIIIPTIVIIIAIRISSPLFWLGDLICVWLLWPACYMIGCRLMMIIVMITMIMMTMVMTIVPQYTTAAASLLHDWLQFFFIEMHWWSWWLLWWLWLACGSLCHVSQGEEEITVMLSTEKLRHWVTRRRWQRCSKVWSLLDHVIMSKVSMISIFRRSVQWRKCRTWCFVEDLFEQRHLKIGGALGLGSLGINIDLLHHDYYYDDNRCHGYHHHHPAQWLSSSSSCSGFHLHLSDTTSLLLIMSW